MKFDDVVAAHLGWLARLAFRFFSRKADAEDLAQETLCRICANRDKFDAERDFKPWALTVMANIFRTWTRRRSLVSFLPLDCSPAVPCPLRADGAAMARDVLSAIRECARMSVGVECVLLYAKGYAYEEIARMVGIPPGTVKSRVSSGRRALRGFLKDC